MTSDDSFYVDLAEVDAFVRDLRAFVTSAADRVDALNASIDRLHISWQGEAAQAHREAHERWVAGMREMRDGVQDVATAARHSHETFTGVQELHRKMWP